MKAVLGKRGGKDEDGCLKMEEYWGSHFFCVWDDGAISKKGRAGCSVCVFLCCVYSTRRVCLVG